MKYSTCLLVALLTTWMMAHTAFSQDGGDNDWLKNATNQSIASSQKDKETQKSAGTEPAAPAKAGEKVSKSDASDEPLSPCGLALPEQFHDGYPIRIAIMDFVSGAELMLGSREFSIFTQPFGKLLSAAKNKTFAFPLGAITLGIELQKQAPKFFTVLPGKNGGGFEDLKAVQEAVLKQGVSHIVFCAVSDIHYKEDANSGVHYGGVNVSRTVYSLDLNIVVYDLSRGQSVLADTYTAEYLEERPFNKDYITRNLFETLMRSVCTKAARKIVEAANVEDDSLGIKPPINAK